jgi:hypothetical protein
MRYALERFIESAHGGSAPTANAQAAFEATVLAIRAHEAVVKGQRLTLAAADFTV